jgi:hypothetical protein
MTPVYLQRTTATFSRKRPQKKPKQKPQKKTSNVKKRKNDNAKDSIFAKTCPYTGLAKESRATDKKKRTEEAKPKERVFNGWIS